MKFAEFMCGPPKVQGSTFNVRLAVAVPLLVVVAAVMALGMSSAALASADCVEGPVVMVRMSAQMFAVPVGYKPHVVDIDRRSHLPRHCRGSDHELLAQPIEAERLTILTNMDGVIQDAHTQSIYGVQVIISPGAPSYSQSRARFNRVRQLVLNTGRSLNELPRRGEFYGVRPYEHDPSRFGYYVATPTGVHTPDGYPLVVDCPSPISPAGRPCSVHYSWSDVLTLRYGFGDVRYPIERWAELDAAVRTFVEYLLIDEESLEENTSE